MGRVRTGWRLARASWSILRTDSSLTMYPAVGIVVAMVLGSALSVIFRVERYRYATTGELTGGFVGRDVEAAFRTA